MHRVWQTGSKHVAGPQDGSYRRPGQSDQSRNDCQAAMAKNITVNPLGVCFFTNQAAALKPSGGGLQQGDLHDHALDTWWKFLLDRDPNEIPSNSMESKTLQ